MAKKTSLAPDPSKEILRLHERISNAFRTSLTDAIRIGELLTEQKKALKHGEFIPWIEQNLPFNRQAATNYMKVYARREEVQALPDMTSAYRLLGMRKPPSEGLKLEPSSNLDSRTEEVKCIPGIHLEPVTPRNDSEEGVEPEIVTVGEDVPEPEPEPEDAGPPIDLSDPIFKEPEKDPDPELLPGKTPKEIIELAGLPKPLNWKGVAPAPKLPPEEPLKVLVIQMVGEDAGEVIEVAEGSIWDVMGRYETRDGLRFACGVGVKKGQKVGHIWEDEPEPEAEPDPLREKRDALPASWVEVLHELMGTRLTEERIAGLLGQILAKARG
jgi:hypothetical protein